MRDGQPSGRRFVTEARRFAAAAVASPHYLSTGTGLAVLAAGGNAVDAAVAANLTLGVVCPYYCGYGGDLMAIVWDGEAHGYRGAGRAPRTATIDAVRSATGTAEMPVLGPHAVTVPGAVEGWFALLERFGTRSFGDLAATALRYARDGFPLTARGAEMLGRCRSLYDGFEDFGAAYAGAVPGARLRQPGLARTIATLAEDGPDTYYRGPIATAIVETLQRQGGLMGTDDLAAHAGAWVDPLRAGYRGVDVLQLPPPTQGVTALEVLRILDELDVPPDGPGRHHLMIEAVKGALADRDAYISDPAAMAVAPEMLFSDPWVAARRVAIDAARASAPSPLRSPDGGTAYLCAADADGLLVSLIQSNFLAAGSGVHVAEWGLNLQNRGASFSLDPQHVNALRPGKLPMHTLIPALALRGGSPWLVFGTMGGHGQAQTHVQILTRMLADGDDPQAAITAPRWSVDPGSWRVAVEQRFPPECLDDLRARGHIIWEARPYDDGMGHAHAIEVETTGYRAATDPRAEGAVLGL